MNKLVTLESLKSLDAVLVHVCCYDIHNPQRPCLRGYLTTAAAIELLRKYSIKNFVISGGQIFGEEIPAISEVTANELKRKLQTLNETNIKVIVVPNIRIRMSNQKVFREMPIRDTSREVDAFIQLANTKGWKNLASVATKTHIDSIKKLYKSRNKHVQVLCVENILSTLPSMKHRRNYRRLIYRMHWSRGELFFKVQEVLKNIILRHPKGEIILKRIVDRLERKPFLGI